MLRVEVGMLSNPREPGLVEGNLHNRNKCMLRRDAQCLQSPLSATKLSFRPLDYPQKVDQIQTRGEG